MSDKYTLIRAEKDNYPVIKMCDWLQVARAAYYRWLAAPATAAARRRVTLAGLVRAAFDASRGRYGARRVAAAVRAGGQPISTRLAGQLLAEQGLVACQPRPFRRTTWPGEQPAAVPDLVGQDFTATAPGTKLVGDITYIRTWTGWLYLATVIDCYSRKVVGWAADTHMRTSLVTAALRMAAGTGRLAEGCIFHSDRGTQYTSAELAAVLSEMDLRGSMGRTGICWDNAMAESFFAALKNELVYTTAFPTPAHARKAVAEYIEVFYNRQRLHSALDYQAPAHVEAEHYKNLIAV